MLVVTVNNERETKGVVYDSCGEAETGGEM